MFVYFGNIMETQQAFVEEIDFSELRFLEIIGRGAFGVVSRARWREIDVAVKLIETESEKKAFITELKQLSRVSHNNIVQLYGASTKHPVYLVMEYAEGGSLYNVLHGTGQLPSYSAAHAMSWTLQCAHGVEYLHDMKPKPLVHRDLKPPNLLLVARGTLLKICDFGTACDAHTHMTNNKGSAAWMAPEVFEGNNYSEKCDVFSWGIILWEVISRRKPFDEIGGPAFRIMWAVHNGTRPPLIRNCPKPLEILMTRCWSANPQKRPSMAEVVRIMAHLFQFFRGADQPLLYPAQEVDQEQVSGESSISSSFLSNTPPYTGPSLGTPDSRNNTMLETIQDYNSKRVPPPVPKKPTTTEDLRIPASLGASRESLVDGCIPSLAVPSDDIGNKRFSADLSVLREFDIAGSSGDAVLQPKASVRTHRRTGSHGNAAVFTAPSPAFVPGHRRTGSYGNSSVISSASAVAMVSSSSPADVYQMHHSTTAPGNLNGSTLLPNQFPNNPLRSVSWTPGWNQYGGAMPNDASGDSAAQNFILMAANHQLQPLPPCNTSPESRQIYERHCQLADTYLRIQAEISHLTQRKKELLVSLQIDEQERMNTTQLQKEYTSLLSENDELKCLHANLKRQVEQIKQTQSSRLTGH